VPAIADRCSLRSLAAEEPLAGTASTIRHWLLIEHPGPWGREGLLDARLPGGLGRDLRALEARSGARVLLIRKTDRIPAYDDGRVICFAVDTRDAWMGVRILGRIDDAPTLDPRDRAAYEDPGGEPLVVVCTHGRRDPCCAELGRPLAEAAATAARGVSWESTHVGGDRFAGNLVAFPHGLYFGRVQPAEVGGLMRAYRDGRSSHPIHVQAAERALRELLGSSRIDAVAPTGGRRRADRAQVAFETSTGAHRVLLERHPGTPMRLTCHASSEQARGAWRVRGIEREGGD
jgi:hypothetical protein